MLWIATLSCSVYIRTNKRWVAWAAVGATIVGWGLLTWGLVWRGLAAGHWPLSNRYEFALCFVWAILSIYLLLEVSWREREASPFLRAESIPKADLSVVVLVIALLVATYALIRPAQEQLIGGLLPALRSPWLQVHVLSTLAGYAALCIAAGLGVIRLIGRDSSDEGEPRRPSVPAPVLSKGLPSAKDIERTMERTVALGFPWLTLGILSGAIWAQQAWGRYWGWDPKEIWALVTWLWYLLILHLWPLRNWRGRRLAGMVIVGFGLILFTYIGVPWLVRTIRLESLHGF
jgi:cytochrome c-type biogenesis protein CcsB